MGRKYTTEEKLAAVQLYEKLGHVTWVIQELGYPSSRTLLYIWLDRYKAGELNKERKRKYSEEQRKAAVEYYMTHGMKSKETVTVMGYPGLTLVKS